MKKYYNQPDFEVSSQTTVTACLKTKKKGKAVRRAPPPPKFILFLFQTLNIPFFFLLFNFKVNKFGNGRSRTYYLLILINSLDYNDAYIKVVKLYFLFKPNDAILFSFLVRPVSQLLSLNYYPLSTLIS